MPASLARSLARGLHRSGVQRIFGMPGGGPNLDMIGCAQELDIKFVLAHTETAACIMASSFGKLTRTPGVALVTRGPGFTSAVNGLAQATLDRFPLLLISDSVTRSSADRTAHQRLDQVASAEPLTKWSGTLGTADPVAVVTACAQLAQSAPAGAVHLAFDPTTPGDKPPALPKARPLDHAVLQRARHVLAGGRRPVVIVGLDALGDTVGTRAALRDVDCPILVTYEAKGVIPESWPTYAGLFTGAALEGSLLEQADVIIGIGVDPVEPVPGSWPYKAPIVLVHSHDVDARYFGAPLVVVGASHQQLRHLLTGCVSDWPTGTGAAIRNRDVARLRAVVPGLDPLDVVRITQEAVGDVLATIDAGAHMLAAMPMWCTDEAGSVLISNGLATMGFSLPAAIAMALARPRRRVVCFIGDGGLSMVVGELETLARLRLNVTVVVFNDATLTLIKLKQVDTPGGRGAVHYNDIDFGAIASAMGVPSRVAHDIAGLRVALTPPDTGPVLVDARVDPSGYRHIIRVTRG